MASAGVARAADEEPSVRTETERAAQSPNPGFAYDARGVAGGAFGAALFSTTTMASSDLTLGGGLQAWGSPIERLTILGDASRDVFGRFAPSGAVAVRLLGDTEVAALSALAKYKVDGFAVGPEHELESEIEMGVLGSLHRAGWHLDANVIAGRGLGDDGEVDSEARLRAGRDLTSAVRIGVDGQARMRLAGGRSRSWDAAGGPQLLIGGKLMFASLTAGPSTMGTSDGRLGWMTLLLVGFGAR